MELLHFICEGNYYNVMLTIFVSYVNVITFENILNRSEVKTLTTREESIAHRWEKKGFEEHMWIEDGE